jgi:hypothetical protein
MADGCEVLEFGTRCLPRNPLFLGCLVDAFVYRLCLSTFHCLRASQEKDLDNKEEVKTSELYRDVTLPAKRFRLRLRVTPNQIPTLVRLKIPWRHQHHVSFTYPDPPLHLSPNATQTFVTILTFDQNTVITKQLYSHTQNIVCRRNNQLVQFSFTQHFLLTQLSTFETFAKRSMILPFKTMFVSTRHSPQSVMNLEKGNFCTLTASPLPPLSSCQHGDLNSPKSQREL